MATTAVRSCFRAGLDRSGSRGHRPGMATRRLCDWLVSALVQPK